jgi:hypothetical protein
MVLGDIPMTPLTALTPPHPYARASAAAHCRRMRSFISTLSDWYFDSIARNTASFCTAGLEHRSGNKSSYSDATP